MLPWQLAEIIKKIYILFQLMIILFYENLFFSFMVLVLVNYNNPILIQQITNAFHSVSHT